jgi:hypothetical protein
VGGGLPVFVEATENRIDDPIHALDIGEYGHGPGSSAHFNEVGLNRIGSLQLPPQTPWIILD